MIMFKNRQEAGIQLGASLLRYKGMGNAVVFGLARGGVVVAFEVARILNLPLNVIVPRKIGAPHSPELAIGAVLEDGSGYFNGPLIEDLQVAKSYIAKKVANEKTKAKKRLALYRQSIPAPTIQNQIVILVDDGIATGSTMFASIAFMRKEKAKKIVVAAPVGSQDTLEMIEKSADEVVCLEPRGDLFSISLFYRDFEEPI